MRRGHRPWPCIGSFRCSVQARDALAKYGRANIARSQREDTERWGRAVRHPRTSKMTIVGSITDSAIASRQVALVFSKFASVAPTQMRQSTIDVQAGRATATTFFDNALRSRKVATGPIALINTADFLPNPLRGCRPCFERYRNICRSSVMVSGQA